MASEGETSCISDPNFAVICNFLDRFGTQCGLKCPDYLTLQEWLENSQDVSVELVNIHIKLLRKIYKSVSVDRWEKVLAKVTHQFSSQDAWEIERFGYKKSRTSSKVRILKHLLEMQFDHHLKFKSEVNKLTADELRSKPIGKDKNGHSYWYLIDELCQIRVYREDPDEETFILVAKDREGLVHLISQLSSGEDIKDIDSNLNEDSNSLEIEKPITDTGQISSSTSVLEDESSNGQIKTNFDQKDESTSSKEDIKEETTTEKVNITPEVPVKEDVKEELVKEDVKEEPVKDDVKEELPVIRLTVKKFAQEKPQETEPEPYPEFSTKKKMILKLVNLKDEEQKESASLSEPPFESLSIESALKLSGYQGNESEDDDSDEPEEEEISLPDHIKQPRLSRPTLLQKTKKKSESEEDDDEEIIEPVMYIKGNGSGEDCNSENIPNYNSIDDEYSEAIEDPIMYFFGEGNGRECETGNEEKIDKKDEKQKSDTANTEIPRTDINLESSNPETVSENVASSSKLICDSTQKNIETESNDKIINIEENVTEPVKKPMFFFGPNSIINPFTLPRKESESKPTTEIENFKVPTSLDKENNTKIDTDLSEINKKLSPENVNKDSKNDDSKSNTELEIDSRISLVSDQSSSIIKNLDIVKDNNRIEDSLALNFIKESSSITEEDKNKTLSTDALLEDIEKLCADDTQENAKDQDNIQDQTTKIEKLSEVDTHDISGLKITKISEKIETVASLSTTDQKSKVVFEDTLEKETKVSHLTSSVKEELILEKKTKDLLPDLHEKSTEHETVPLNIDSIKDKADLPCKVTSNKSNDLNVDGNKLKTSVESVTEESSQKICAKIDNKIIKDSPILALSSDSKTSHQSIEKCKDYIDSSKEIENKKIKVIHDGNISSEGFKSSPKDGNVSEHSKMSTKETFDPSKDIKKRVFKDNISESSDNKNSTKIETVVQNTSTERLPNVNVDNKQHLVKDAQKILNMAVDVNKIDSSNITPKNIHLDSLPVCENMELEKNVKRTSSQSNDNELSKTDPDKKSQLQEKEENVTKQIKDYCTKKMEEPNEKLQGNNEPSLKNKNKMSVDKTDNAAVEIIHTDVSKNISAKTSSLEHKKSDCNLTPKTTVKEHNAKNRTEDVKIKDVSLFDKSKTDDIKSTKLICESIKLDVKEKSETLGCKKDTKNVTILNKETKSDALQIIDEISINKSKDTISLPPINEDKMVAKSVDVLNKELGNKSDEPLKIDIEKNLRDENDDKSINQKKINKTSLSTDKIPPLESSSSKEITKTILQTEVNLIVSCETLNEKETKTKENLEKTKLKKSENKIEIIKLKKEDISTKSDVDSDSKKTTKDVKIIASKEISKSQTKISNINENIVNLEACVSKVTNVDFSLQENTTKSKINSTSDKMDKIALNLEEKTDFEAVNKSTKDDSPKSKKDNKANIGDVKAHDNKIEDSTGSKISKKESSLPNLESGISKDIKDYTSKSGEKIQAGENKVSRIKEDRKQKDDVKISNKQSEDNTNSNLTKHIVDLDSTKVKAHDLPPPTKDVTIDVRNTICDIKTKDIAVNLKPEITEINIDQTLKDEGYSKVEKIPDLKTNEKKELCSLLKQEDKKLDMGKEDKTVDVILKESQKKSSTSTEIKHDTQSKVSEKEKDTKLKVNTELEISDVLKTSKETPSILIDKTEKSKKVTDVKDDTKKLDSSIKTKLSEEKFTISSDTSKMKIETTEDLKHEQSNKEIKDSKVTTIKECSRNLDTNVKTQTTTEKSKTSKTPEKEKEGNKTTFKESTRNLDSNSKVQTSEEKSSTSIKIVTSKTPETEQKDKKAATTTIKDSIEKLDSNVNAQTSEQKSSTSIKVDTSKPSKIEHKENKLTTITDGTKKLESNVKEQTSKETSSTLIKVDTSKTSEKEQKDNKFTTIEDSTKTLDSNVKPQTSKEKSSTSSKHDASKISEKEKVVNIKKNTTKMESSIKTQLGKEKAIDDTSKTEMKNITSQPVKQGKKATSIQEIAKKLESNLKSQSSNEQTSISIKDDKSKVEMKEDLKNKNLDKKEEGNKIATIKESTKSLDTKVSSKEKSVQKDTPKIEIKNVQNERSDKEKEGGKVATAQESKEKLKSNVTLKSSKELSVEVDKSKVEMKDDIKTRNPNKEKEEIKDAAIQESSKTLESNIKLQSSKELSVEVDKSKVEMKDDVTTKKPNKEKEELKDSVVQDSNKKLERNIKLQSSKELSEEVKKSKVEMKDDVKTKKPDKDKEETNDATVQDSTKKLENNVKLPSSKEQQEKKVTTAQESAKKLEINLKLPSSKEQPSISVERDKSKTEVKENVKNKQPEKEKEEKKVAPIKESTKNLESNIKVSSGNEKLIGEVSLKIESKDVKSKTNEKGEDGKNIISIQESSKKLESNLRSQSSKEQTSTSVEDDKSKIEKKYVKTKKPDKEKEEETVIIIKETTKKLESDIKPQSSKENAIKDEKSIAINQKYEKEKDVKKVTTVQDSSKKMENTLQSSKEQSSIKDDKAETQKKENVTNKKSDKEMEDKKVVNVQESTKKESKENIDTSKIQTKNDVYNKTSEEEKDEKKVTSVKQKTEKLESKLLPNKEQTSILIEGAESKIELKEKSDKEMEETKITTVQESTKNLESNLNVQSSKEKEFKGDESKIEIKDEKNKLPEKEKGTPVQEGATKLESKETKEDIKNMKPDKEKEEKKDTTVQASTKKVESDIKLQSDKKPSVEDATSKIETKENEKNEKPNKEIEEKLIPAVPESSKKLKNTLKIQSNKEKPIEDIPKIEMKDVKNKLSEKDKDEQIVASIQGSTKNLQSSEEKPVEVNTAKIGIKKDLKNKPLEKEVVATVQGSTKKLKGNLKLKSSKAKPSISIEEDEFKIVMKDEVKKMPSDKEKIVATEDAPKKLERTTRLRSSRGKPSISTKDDTSKIEAKNKPSESEKEEIKVVTIQEDNKKLERTTRLRSSRGKPSISTEDEASKIETKDKPPVKEPEVKKVTPIQVDTKKLTGSKKLKSNKGKSSIPIEDDASKIEIKEKVAPIQKETKKGERVTRLRSSKEKPLISSEANKESSLEANKKGNAKGVAAAKRDISKITVKKGKTVEPLPVPLESDSDNSSTGFAEPFEELPFEEEALSPKNNETDDISSPPVTKPLLTVIDITKLQKRFDDTEPVQPENKILTNVSKSIPSPIIILDNDSNDVIPTIETDPLACTEEDLQAQEGTSKPTTLSSFSLDVDEEPDEQPLLVPMRRSLRGREVSVVPVPAPKPKNRKRPHEPEPEKIEVVSKKQKTKGKRNINVNLRKSIELQKLDIVSSDEEEPIKPEVTKKPSKPTKGKKSKGKAKVSEAKEDNVEKPEVTSDGQSEVTKTESKSKKKPESKNKKILLGLEVDAIIPVEDELETSGRSLRHSRRIAQQKIKEDADNGKIEEEVMSSSKSKHKKKKNKDKDKEYKVESKKAESSKKKKGKKVTEDEAEESDDNSKRKRKKREKLRKLFNMANPWKSSTDDSSPEEEEEEEVEYEVSEEEVKETLKSDHEFSPESDLESTIEIQPTRRARTVKKESDTEEPDDYACQKCSKTDHPEWILLCDKCDCGWHCSCLRPALLGIPEGEWFCPPCQHIKLIEALKNELVEYDIKANKLEIEVRRKERLAYVGISLDNVLPLKNQHDIKKKDDESEDSSESSSSSGSGSSSDDSDEPIYQLRQRRQAQTYRFNDYDDLINSAIQDEIEAERGAGNLGRGKDIATIVNAEKEERAQSEVVQSNESEIPPVVPIEKETDDQQPKPEGTKHEESEEEPLRVVPKHVGRKKQRKLNCLDVNSEEEGDSDESFKGDSGSDEDEFEEEIDSDDSDCVRKRATRRSTRTRTTRYDREFIDDSEDDSPRKKKSRSVWDESESEDSDKSWGRRGKYKKNRSSFMTYSKSRKKSKKKKRRREDSDDDRPKKKRPRIVYGGLDDSEDEMAARRTRGKKITYVDTLGSDSEEEKKKPSRRIESEDEYVANEEEEDEDVVDEDEEQQQPQEQEESAPVEKEENLEKQTAISEEDDEIPPVVPMKIMNLPELELIPKSPRARGRGRGFGGPQRVPKITIATNILPTTVPGPKLHEEARDSEKEEGYQRIRTVEIKKPAIPIDIPIIAANPDNIDDEAVVQMMESEEYANKQLELMAIQLAKERERKKELELQQQRMNFPIQVPIPPLIIRTSSIVEPTEPKKRGRRKKFVEGISPLKQQLQAKLVPPMIINKALITPPPVLIETDQEKPIIPQENIQVPTVIQELPTTPPKRRGRGKGKKTLAAEAAASTSPDDKNSQSNPLTPENNSRTSGDSNPGDTSFQPGKLTVAAPPQPFSQSQPTPSVITRMLQSQPLQSQSFTTAASAMNQKYFGGMDQPRGPPSQFGNVPPRGSVSSPYRPNVPPGQYPPQRPVLNPGSPHRLQSPGSQNMQMYHSPHRPLDPSPSGGGHIMSNTSTSDRQSPLENKGGPTPPPQYNRPMPRFPAATESPLENKGGPTPSPQYNRPMTRFPAATEASLETKGGPTTPPQYNRPMPRFPAATEAPIESKGGPTPPPQYNRPMPRFPPATDAPIESKGGPTPPPQYNRPMPRFPAPTEAPIESKGGPTPPPQYNRPMPRFPATEPSSGTNVRPQPLPFQTASPPRGNFSPYNSAQPANFNYGTYPTPAALTTAEDALPATAYQNTSFPEQFNNPVENVTQSSEGSNSKPFEEEGSGEFGGLVSYFSSQREDDLDT